LSNIYADSILTFFNCIAARLITLCALFRNSVGKVLSACETLRIAVNKSPSPDAA
jgi:hypothetical protein